jgi:hypothetical protein
MITQKLPKAAITKLLRRSQLAEFTTKQFGDQVIVTFNTADLAYFQNALRIAGFSFDFVIIANDESISYGLNCCSLDEYESETISLIVSLRWTQEQADSFIASAARAIVKADA